MPYKSPRVTSLPLPGVILFAMTTLFSDTTPEAEAVLIRLLCQAPTWCKLEMVDQLNPSVKLLALAGLRQRFPNDGEGYLHCRLADLLLGDELALKVDVFIRKERPFDRIKFQRRVEQLVATNNVF